MTRAHHSATQRASSFGGKAGYRTGRGLPERSEFADRQATPGPMAREPHAPGAVECPTCGTWVDALKSGAPRAHAAGGYGTSPIKGHPACVGSGAPIHDAGYRLFSLETPATLVLDGGSAVYQVRPVEPDEAARVGCPHDNAYAEGHVFGAYGQLEDLRRAGVGSAPVPVNGYRDRRGYRVAFITSDGGRTANLRGYVLAPR